MLDLALYPARLNAALGNPRYRSRLDVMVDGVVNIRDVARVVTLMGTTCPGGNPDDDSDGFRNIDEVFIGTDPLDSCPDGPADDAWPLDLASGLGIGTHDGKINILDIVLLTPPYFNTRPPDPYYLARRDFNRDGAINVLDTVRLVPPAFNTTCTP